MQPFPSSQIRAPRAGQTGFTTAFFEAIIKEVTRACSITFSQNFTVRGQGGGGMFVDVTTSGASVFSGTAYIAGNKTTGLGTKKWVRCFLDTATAEDNDGDPPNPFPPNEEWYEVSKTSGDIHITRA
jgi:hypothetical protein